MATRKRPFSVKWHLDEQTSTWRFAVYNLDNVIVTDRAGKPLSDRVCLAKLHEKNRHFAALFGLKQTVGDAGALGQDASVFEKFAGMVERARFLETGSPDWTQAREPGEGTILFKALMLQKPERDPIKVREMVGAMKPSERAKHEMDSRLAPFVAQVRAAMAADVDTDELFAELDGEAEE